MKNFELTKEQVIDRFEKVTGEKATDYPTATTMDFFIWTREEIEVQRRIRLNIPMTA